MSAAARRLPDRIPGEVARRPRARNVVDVRPDRERIYSTILLSNIILGIRFRQEGTRIFYGVQDPAAIQVIGALHGIFCRPDRRRPNIKEK